MKLKMLTNHTVFLNGQTVALVEGQTVDVDNKFVAESLLKFEKAEKVVEGAQKAETKDDNAGETETQEGFDVDPSKMTLEEIKDFAAANEIDLGDVKSVKKARESLTAALLDAADETDDLLD